MGRAEFPLLWVKSTELQQIFLTLQDAVNVLTDDNFPDALTGDTLIKTASLTGNRLIDTTTPLKKLSWLEWPIPLVALAQPASTTTTLDCGGFWVYDPAKYVAGGGKWYFECAIKTTNATYAASVALKYGTTTIGTVTTTATDYTVIRSTALTMPVAQQVLTLTLSSADASATAYLWTARMIFVP